MVYSASVLGLGGTHGCLGLGGFLGFGGVLSFGGFLGFGVFLGLGGLPRWISRPRSRPQWPRPRWPRSRCLCLGGLLGCQAGWLTTRSDAPKILGAGLPQIFSNHVEEEPQKSQLSQQLHCDTLFSHSHLQHLRWLRAAHVLVVPPKHCTAPPLFIDLMTIIPMSGKKKRPAPRESLLSRQNVWLEGFVQACRLGH